MIILAELSPLDTVAGTRKLLRASSANDPAVTGLNDVIWRPAITEEAEIGIRLFKGDFDGQAAPSTGSLSVQIDQWLSIEPNVRRFLWQGAPVKFYAGVSGQAWPWTVVFEGLVDQFSAEANTVKLNLKVNTEPFDADVLTLKYAGTGGAEGDANLKDKVKPFLLGRCFNVEPILINSVDNVLQFSGYGAIQAVNFLYERGSGFGASQGNYATYAALVAATIPPGQWATCLAQGMIRLGAPPYGVITGDIDGDKVGGTWWRKTGEIIQRIASNSGVSGSLIESASFTALDTALAGLSNQGRIGVFIDSQESVLDMAAKLAAPCNAQVGVSLAGKMFVGRVAIGTPTITLDAQQRQLPRVTSSAEVSVSPPFSYIEMGYARSWRKHTDEEIAGIENLPSYQFPTPLPGYFGGTGHEYINATGHRFRFDGQQLFFGGEALTFNGEPIYTSGYVDAQDQASVQALADAAAADAAAAAAQSAASAAQSAADLGAASAATALGLLTEIASDGILTPDEKPRVIMDRDVILAEQSGIDAQAAAFGVTTERTAYNAAVTALTNYLATLTVPVLWSNLSGNTNITGATFRNTFASVYSARQTLLNKIADVAKVRADLGVTNAAAAQSTANAAAAAATIAQGLANDAQATADGKVRTFYQASAPTAEGVGDLWFDTDDGNKQYRWSGSAWVLAQDTAIGTAISAAAGAQATADGKVTTFYVETTPTAEALGDLWFKPSTGFLTRWNGSAWVDVANIGATAAQVSSITAALNNAANAQATADGKVRTFYQASAPTAEGVGDLWFDTDDGNKQYRWSGSAWLAVQDAGIGQAITDAAGAQATADGKVTTFVSETTPTAEGVGDLWFKASTGELRRWSGSAWGDPLVDLTAAKSPDLTGNFQWDISADTTGTVITSPLPSDRRYKGMEGVTDRSPTTSFVLSSVSASISLTVNNTVNSADRGVVTLGTGTTGSGTAVLTATLPSGGVVSRIITVTKTNAFPPTGGASGSTFAQDTTFNTITSGSHAAISDELICRSNGSSQVRVSVDLEYAVSGGTASRTPRFKVSYATSAGGSLTDLFSEESGSACQGGTEPIEGSYNRAEATFTMPSANTDYYFKLQGRRNIGSGNIAFTGNSFTVRQ
jgi:hypothetical protein